LETAEAGRVVGFVRAEAGREVEVEVVVARAVSDPPAPEDGRRLSLRSVVLLRPLRSDSEPTEVAGWWWWWWWWWGLVQLRV